MGNTYTSGSGYTANFFMAVPEDTPDRWVLTNGVWVEFPKPPTPWATTTTHIGVGTNLPYTTNGSNSNNITWTSGA